MIAVSVIVALCSGLETCMRAVLDRRRNCAWRDMAQRRSTKGTEQRRMKRSGKQKRKQISSPDTEGMDQVKSILWKGKTLRFCYWEGYRSSRTVLNLKNAREKMLPSHNCL